MEWIRLIEQEVTKSPQQPNLEFKKVVSKWFTWHFCSANFWVIFVNKRIGVWRLSVSCTKLLKITERWIAIVQASL